jgi:drug/metabolite transporter (DMT)-like permease
MAEMMISGLELSLGAVAARAFRGRRIAPTRWAGVTIVVIGVMIVERANRGRHRGTDDDDDDEATEDRGDDAVRLHGESASDAMIGIILIILQSMLSVLQDIGEEIFMQAADFPATKMLGMEGSYGFCVGLIAYGTTTTAAATASTSVATTLMTTMTQASQLTTATTRFPRAPTPRFCKLSLTFLTMAMKCMDQIDIIREAGYGANKQFSKHVIVCRSII